MPTTPQREAGWRMEPPVSEPRVRGVSRAATAAELPPLLPPGTRSQIPWVAGWPIRGIFGGGSHGELIEVQSPSKDCSRLLEFLGYGCVVGRNVVFQNPTRRGQRLPLDADYILQPNGNSISGPFDCP